MCFLLPGLRFLLPSLLPCLFVAFFRLPLGSLFVRAVLLFLLQLLDGLSQFLRRLFLLLLCRGRIVLPQFFFSRLLAFQGPLYMLPGHFV